MTHTQLSQRPFIIKRKDRGGWGGGGRGAREEDWLTILPTPWRWTTRNFQRNSAPLESPSTQPIRQSATRRASSPTVSVWWWRSGDRLGSSEREGGTAGRRERRGTGLIEASPRTLLRCRFLPAPPFCFTLPVTSPAAPPAAHVRRVRVGVMRGGVLFCCVCVCVFLWSFQCVGGPKARCLCEDSPGSVGEDEAAEGPSVECVAQVGYTTQANNNIFD